MIAVGGVVFAVLMALSTRYGFHRDELYFLDCARHLQASYVDQPVLTPLLAWVSLKLFGVSLPGLRMWPALAAWATVVVGGLTAREFGGGRRAQLLAAIATATMPVLLGQRSPVRPDGLRRAGLGGAGAGRRAGSGGPATRAGGWLGGLVARARAGQQAQRGLLRRRAGRRRCCSAAAGGWSLNRWFLAGAAIAAAFTDPRHLVAGAAPVGHDRDDPRAQPGKRRPGQHRRLGDRAADHGRRLALVWVWVAGLRFLWRSGRPLWRALAWAYGLLFVFFAVTTGAKIYYLAGAYVYLLAAGAVAIDGWLAARHGRLRSLLLATALTTAIAVPLVLPVLPPAASAGPTRSTRSWPRPSAGRSWSAPSAAYGPRCRRGQRASAVIFTGELRRGRRDQRAGPGTGLPTAVSGHNTLLVVGPGQPATPPPWSRSCPGLSTAPATPAYLSSSSPACGRRPRCPTRTACTTRSGRPRLPVHRPPPPWAQMWPQLRHYD